MDRVSSLSCTILRNRAHCMAMFLLLINFDIGDFIRWLGGVYTHDHITLDPIHRATNSLRLHFNEMIF